MMYQGGKARIASQISEILIRQADGPDAPTTYVEPFLGSAAVFSRVAPHYQRAIGADAQEDLVHLWQAARLGWVPPEELTRELYEQLRHAEPSALRAFAGFPCSFGGKWFGGYARDPKSDRNFARTASRSIVRRARGLADATILHADYRQLVDLVGPGTLVYADPPYAGTLAYAGAGSFDSEEFWATMRDWDDHGALVLVSEYTAPADWVEVWSVDRHVSTARDNSGKRATDRLFALPATARALGF
jgi:DNA adenine methylase